jgi:hypothetical protein
MSAPASPEPSVAQQQDAIDPVSSEGQVNEASEVVSKSSISETVVSGITDTDITANPVASNPRSASPNPQRAQSPSSTASTSSNSPLRQRVTSALRAHGEKVTWPDDWKRVEETMDAEAVKFSFAVSSPETVSSMMKK